MKMLLICGVLLMFTGSAVGLITVDDQCRSDQSCVFYGALGRPLYLQLPEGDTLQLNKIISGTFTRIFRFINPEIRINHLDPRWRFNTETKTMIITRAEKEDSGRYRLDIWDSDGRSTGPYSFHLIIEAVVSSVEMMYSCFFRGMKGVFCFSDGDQIQFNWTLNGIPHNQNLTDGNQTLLLDKDYTGNVTCYVKNDVSSGNRTIEVRECSDKSSVMMFSTESPAVNQCTQWDNGLMVFVTVWLFEVIILVSLLVGAFYIYTRIYRKQRAAESKE